MLTPQIGTWPCSPNVNGQVAFHKRIRYTGRSLSKSPCGPNADVNRFFENIHRYIRVNISSEKK